MAAVFETYEKQFATITADITARIGRIPNLVGSKLLAEVTRLIKLSLDLVLYID